jgi:ATP/maltotriose-dependent transcriptional regulator MalT
MNSKYARKNCSATLMLADSGAPTIAETTQSQPTLGRIAEGNTTVRKNNRQMATLISNVDGYEQAHAVARTEVAMSPREYVVLKLICRGLSNKQIARELKSAPETVKSHATHILVKFRAKTRAAAVAQAVRFGLTEVLQ